MKGPELRVITFGVILSEKYEERQGQTTIWVDEDSQVLR